MRGLIGEYSVASELCGDTKSKRPSDKSFLYAGINRISLILLAGQTTNGRVPLSKICRHSLSTGE